MSRLAPLPRLLALPLLILGLLVVAAGALLQSRGVEVPAMLGRTTVFGVMAQCGGALGLCGLAMFALSLVLDADRRRDERFRRVGADLPAAVARGTGARPKGAGHGRLPAVTPQQVAAWQMRLAERTVHLGAAPAAMPQRRVGQELHRAAMAIIAGALACLLVLAALAPARHRPGLPGVVGRVAPETADGALSAAQAGGHAALALLGLIAGGALCLVALAAAWRRLRRGGAMARRRYRDLAAG